MLVDAMLGSLARWLRLLGIDAALAPNHESDAALVRRARAEDRLLITRDTQLAQRRGMRALLIESMDLRQQLAQVLRHLPIDRARIGSRCMQCNVPLTPLTRTEAHARVPPYVFQTQDRFFECPECHRVYWAGTHWQRMKALLDEVLAEADKNPSPEQDSASRDDLFPG